MRKLLPIAFAVSFLFWGCSEITSPESNPTLAKNENSTRAAGLYAKVLHVSSKAGLIDLYNNDFQHCRLLRSYGATNEGVMHFDGKSSLSLDKNIALGMNSFTISFDIKASLHDSPIISQSPFGINASRKGWNIQCENTPGRGAGVRFDISDGTRATENLLSTGPEALDNKWHSILIKFDRAAGYASIYMDGVEKQRTSIAHIGVIDPVNNHLKIGSRRDGWVDLLGQLDNVKIFSSLVDCADIDSKLGDLVSFSGDYGRLLNESDPNATIYNSGVTILSNNSKGIKFDNFLNPTEYRNDYINCGDPAKEYANFFNASFNISFSIKAPAQDGVIISKNKGAVTASKRGWNIQCENTIGQGAGIRFDISDGIKNSTGLLSTGIEVLDNEWHDVIINFDRETGFATIAVDGIEKDRADISDIQSLYGNDDDLLIGWRGDWWKYFTGYLDNIIIEKWN